MASQGSWARISKSSKSHWLRISGLIFAVTMTAVIRPASAGDSNTLLPILYSEGGRLCSVSATGKEGRACARTGHEIDSPSWQPRGRLIVTELGEHDGLHALWLLNAVGRPVRQLTESTDFYRPIWLPDGRHIVGLNYSITHTIRQWNEEGGKYTDMQIDGFETAYQRLQMVAISPSARHAAFVVDDFKHLLIVDIDAAGEHWTATSGGYRPGYRWKQRATKSLCYRDLGGRFVTSR